MRPVNLTKWSVATTRVEAYFQGMQNGKIDVVPAKYVPPTLADLGSVRELTLACTKAYGESDGFNFQGQAIYTVSCSA